MASAQFGVEGQYGGHHHHDGDTPSRSDYVRASAALLQKGLADCVRWPINTVGETNVARAFLWRCHPFGVGGSAFRVGCT